jgi:hypothetical protein
METVGIVNVSKKSSFNKNNKPIVETFAIGNNFIMELYTDKINKYTFSGHDSFQCRQFWLKKGYDFVGNGKSFNDDNAVVSLGVGKNMVASIRHWLKAFNITDSKDLITDFGNSLLDDNGFDPFLEDDGSLWLLHYHLVKSNFASTYSLIFNEFRREKIEFNRESFVAYVKRKSEVIKGINYNPKTIADDFDVFRKLYLSSSSDKVSEDGYSGLLSELALVTKIENRIDNKKEEFFAIENSTKHKLPVEIFLYSILENSNYGLSVSLNSLEQDFDSPGAIFAMNRSGLIEKIKEAQTKYDYVIYNDNAGIKELQFKRKPEPLIILEDYYG